MSLAEDLAKLREESKGQIPADQYEVMLKEGDIAPEFVLPNAIGADVSLSELLKKGPVVLSFYRGGW